MSWSPMRGPGPPRKVNGAYDPRAVNIYLVETKASGSIDPRGLTERARGTLLAFPREHIIIGDANYLAEVKAGADIYWEAVRRRDGSVKTYEALAIAMIEVGPDTWAERSPWQRCQCGLAQRHQRTVRWRRGLPSGARNGPSRAWPEPGTGGLGGEAARPRRSGSRPLLGLSESGRQQCRWHAPTGGQGGRLCCEPARVDPASVAAPAVALRARRAVPAQRRDGQGGSVAHRAVAARTDADATGGAADEPRSDSRHGRDAQPRRRDDGDGVPINPSVAGGSDVRSL